jgi:hypothetical protein
MKNKSKIIIRSSNLSLIILFLWLLVGCKPAVSVFNKDGWSIEADTKKEALTISYENLGPLLKNIQLALKKDEGISTLSKWAAKSKKDVLTLTSKEPESTTWKFEASKEKLDISCSVGNALLLGAAPAAENRIPARTESQDNGILYTSLGFVSSGNIRCLFDRETDMLVQFSEQSSLKRNPSDAMLMDVAIPAGEGAEISLVPDYYLKVLGLNDYKPIPKRFKTAPVGWCSWYCYYMGTMETDMVTETDALARYLKPYGLEVVQLDACYTLGNDASYLVWTPKTFPKGGKWVFDYIKSKGLKPGLWINIYGSNYAKAEMANKYPENFYLRDKNGKLSPACCTGDDTEVKLDYSNPEVIEKHLKPMFKILKEDWGLAYLKDAGWGEWMDYYDQNRERAFNPSKGSREAYLDAQIALRETLGGKVYIDGCAMHEIGFCLGVFDSSRTGGDDRAVWYPERRDGTSMQTFFNSLFGANYLNNIVWFCDPDTVMVRNPLTMDEARTIVSAIALTGQLYMASDFMARLPQRRLDLYRKTMPTTPIVPIDLYPYKIKFNKRNGVVWCCPQVKEYPRAIDLKVSAESGVYDVVAVFNWADKEEVKTIDLANDLGLEIGKDYLIFDFWDQKLKEITKDKIESSIPGHGACVYVVKPVLERPQLLATSRHITGAVSIKKVDWDSSKSILSGVSETVEEAPYSIFIHVPAGKAVSKVDADAEMLFYKMTDNVLEVKFAGYPGKEGLRTINWKIEF